MFVAAKLAILPVPLPPKPIAVLLFVQLYTIVPPVVGLVKVTAVVLAPTHTLWLATVFTVAIGFIVIVNICAVPIHDTPFAV